MESLRAVGFTIPSWNELIRAENHDRVLAEKEDASQPWVGRQQEVAVAVHHTFLEGEEIPRVGQTWKRARLVVVSAEVGGRRFSSGTFQFLRGLVTALIFRHTSSTSTSTTTTSFTVLNTTNKSIMSTINTKSTSAKSTATTISTSTTTTTSSTWISTTTMSSTVTSTTIQRSTSTTNTSLTLTSTSTSSTSTRNDLHGDQHNSCEESTALTADSPYSSLSLGLLGVLSLYVASGSVVTLVWPANPCGGIVISARTGGQ